MIFADLQHQRRAAAYLDFYRHILVDDIDDVKVISIRRPDALNALHDEITNEILTVTKQFENDAAVKGFVLTGYGTRAFCAGADIGRFPAMLGNAEAATQRETLPGASGMVSLLRCCNAA